MFHLFSNERRVRITHWISDHMLTRILVSHTSLAFCYGIFLFLYDIALLREVIPVVHPILIGWAGGLFLYDVFIRDFWGKLPRWKPLALFVIATGLTALSTLEAGLSTGIKSVIMVALPLCAFYPVCLLEAKANWENALVKALMGAAVIVFLASLTAVGMYLVRFSAVVRFLGAEKLTGFRYYSPNDPSSGMILYGLYEDTNHAAIYALVFAVYSIVLYSACGKGLFGKDWKNKVGRIFAVTNFVIQLVYFPLANSRGGWLCLGVAGIMALFLYFFYTKFEKKKMWIRVAQSAGISALCILLIFGCLLGLREGTSFISSTIHQGSFGEIKEPTVQDVTEPMEPSQGMPGDNFTKKDTSLGSGRIWIWKEALKLYIRRPIFGVGANYQFYSEKYGVAPHSMGYGKAVHNSYLDLLLEHGLVGFVLMMSFWVLCLCDVLKKVHRNGRRLELEYVAVLFAVFLVAGASFFLSCVFVNTTAMYYVMLVMTGYLVACEKEVA